MGHMSAIPQQENNMKLFFGWSVVKTNNNETKSGWTIMVTVMSINLIDAEQIV